MTTDTTTPRIGLCMIMRNEEDTLENCLDSVQGLVSEMVVVDTGSSDHSRDIAQAAGARLYEFTWADDFSAARNHALQQVTADWVLVLDADETISASDHPRLAALAAGGKADAWSLVQRTYGDNLVHSDFTLAGADRYRESRPFAGWIPSRLVRLFRNDPRYRYRYRIHELIEPSILESGGRFLDADIPIHHFNKLKAPGDIRAKLERYLRLGLRQIEETPHDAKPCLETALVYNELGNPAAAEDLLRKALTLSPRDVHVHAALAAQLIDTGKPEQARSVLQNGIELDPNHVGMLNMLASVRLGAGDPDGALQLLQRARELAPDSPLTHNNLGLLHAVTHRHDEAIRAYRRSLELNPRNLNALTNLGMLYTVQKQFGAARAVLEQASQLRGDDPRILYHLALSVAGLGDSGRARTLLARAREFAPGDPAIEQALQSLR